MIFPNVIISDETLNLNIARDLEILRKYAWKENNVPKHRVCIDKKERAARKAFYIGKSTRKGVKLHNNCYMG